MNPRQIFSGSDAEATKALYRRLETLGPIGVIALNLFRAQKASERAKLYRGGQPGRGSYKSMAYERKQWAMGNLCQALNEHATALALPWGWKHDPAQPYYPWVLYIELPTGQVSFHTAARGLGPDYPNDWDRISFQSAPRIISWVTALLEIPQPSETLSLGL